MIFYYLFLFGFLLINCHNTNDKFIDLNGNGEMDVYENPELSSKIRAKDLVSRLTLEEKVGLMGSNAKAVKRLGIQEFGWDNEGKHAIVTCFPSSIGIAATWNTTQVFQIANALSDEARVMSRTDTTNGEQLRWLSFWAPTINMARDPRWGRTMETYGEDPFLSSEIGIPFIKGMQGNNEKYLKVVAGVNHMAVYNRELGRHELNAVVKDEKLLREYYLSGFKKCVIYGQNAGIGASNNAVNGVPACINQWLLSHVLREEWGYKGYVFSDAASVNDVAGIRHYVPSQEQAMGMAIRAGCDIDCGNSFQRYLKKTIDSQLLNERLLDSSLVRSLTVRFQLGMFDPARLNPYNNIPDTLLDGNKHRQLALNSARESIVLLKNDKNVLPLSQSVKTILVAGPRADKPELGRKQTGRSSKNISVLQGLKDRFKHANVLYSRDIKEALTHTTNADLIIYCTSLMEGEVADRFNLRLSTRQEEDIIRLSKTNKPMVVVLYSGSAVDVSPWINKVNGLLEAWYPGEEGGNAVADIISGKYNPSGKLPITFYKNTASLPPFDDFDITRGRTYMYQKTKPGYPFGFGLSYTTFKTKLENAYQKDLALHVTASVENTGKKEGAEVVQLYMSYSGDRSRGFPAKQLKGFQKVFLKPGEKKRVQFIIKPEDIAFYDNDLNWKIFPGKYHVGVGNSSNHIVSSTAFEFKNETILKKGPQMLYSNLTVSNTQVKSGSYFPVDFYCQNKGDISGRVEIMVDDKPFTLPDTYLGPKQSGKFRFMVQMMGATRHSINLKGHKPVFLNLSAGDPELIVRSLITNQTCIVNQAMNLEFLTINNGDKAKSFNCRLEINGKVVATKKINIQPGEDKNVRFTYTFPQPGTYDVTLNGEGKLRIIAGGAIQKSFSFFSNVKARFYQVNSNSFWASSTGSVGGTPISNNYGERTADDSYGVVYLSKAMTDNCAAMVRIHSQQLTGNYAKVGLMVRNKISESGKSGGYCIASVHSYYGGGGLFEWDAQGTGFLDSLKRFTLPAFPNKWIRIEKHKKLFIIWSGTDGQHWKKQLNIQIPDANDIQDVGVFVTSDNLLEPCKVIFSDFKIFKTNTFLKETDISRPIKKEMQFTTEPL
ncbi:MAG: hypothetical protein JWR67_1382 [Mucilaginibacter sp.]|nr:hypothetical protein [Mucilaginibacter sp.]